MSEHEVADLLTVQQAIRVLDHVPVFPKIIRIPLDDAAGLRLAEDLKADRDFPPFEKSLMDGYAVLSADVATGQAALRVVGTIAAGQSPERAIQPGETMAIMTGASLPGGADGVVPVEDVAARVPLGDTVQVLRATSPQRHVAARGSDCPAGRTVLTQGTLIGPAQIAVMASIGAATMQCFARPRVAVLGTGDELVPVDQTPGDCQIRDSNTHMLVALLRRLGCDVVAVENVRDDPELIREAIRRGMAHDALFITGGMSMGEFDYVPRLLQELGVDLKITKLRIKPGKPFVFGVGEGAGFGVQGSGEEEGRGDAESRGRGEKAGVGEGESGRGGDSEEGVGGGEVGGGGDSEEGVGGGEVGGGGDSEEGVGEGVSGREGDRAVDSMTFSSSPPLPLSPSRLLPASPRPRVPASSYIFGLPGNPVSAFVCTLRLASRLLSRLAGGVPEERWMSGRLDAGLPANGPREFYQPALRHPADGQHSAHAAFATITPLHWKGSADLFTLATANVLIVRAENETAMPKGTVVRVLEI